MSAAITWRYIRETDIDVFSITMLPASEGDCLWVEYGDQANPRRVLIDAGRKGTYKQLKQRFEALPENQRIFELFVITHIDRDHIEGALHVLGDMDEPVRFRDIWFNGYKHLEEATGEAMGAVAGETLTWLLRRPGRPWNEAFQGKAIYCEEEGPLREIDLPGGLKITLLSPTVPKLQALMKEWDKVCRKEGIVPGSGHAPDDAENEAYGAPNVEVAAGEAFVPDAAPANGSSIAFIAEYGEQKVLFGADAHPDVLIRSLARFNGGGKVGLAAFKVSHHGSSHNTSIELLEAIDCPTYLFSTNGSYFHHPSESAVARVIKHGKAKELFFNYRSDENTIWDSEAYTTPWKFTPRYPAAAGGEMRVDLL